MLMLPLTRPACKSLSLALAIVVPWILLPGKAVHAQHPAVTPLVTNFEGFGLGSDGSNLFFTHFSPSRIYSVPLAGGTPTQLYSYSTGSPFDVTALGANLFWIDPNSGPGTDTQILRAPKNGSGPITPIYTGSSVGQPIVDGSSIATNGVLLFTADEVNGRVHRLNPDGTGLIQLGPDRYTGGFSTEHLNRITVSATTAYIADAGFSNGSITITPKVVSIPTSGDTFTTLHAGAPFNYLSGIALDAANNTLYLSDQGPNRIWKMSTSGGPPELLLTDPRFGTLDDIEFVNGYLYLTDRGAETVWKVDLAAVPEPSSFLLIGCSAAACGYYLWKKHRRNSERTELAHA
jgi:hypothetical protein